MTYFGPHTTTPPNSRLTQPRSPTAWDRPERVGAPSLRDYIKAEASLFKQGPVPLPVYEERVGPKGCGTCPGRVATLEGKSDPVGFCTKCGCGSRERAALSVKAQMPDASCPLPGPAKRWGPSPGEGRHALARLPGGVTGQALSVVKGVGRELKRRLRLRRGNNPKK